MNGVIQSNFHIILYLKTWTNSLSIQIPNIVYSFEQIIFPYWKLRGTSLYSHITYRRPYLCPTIKYYTPTLTSRFSLETFISPWVCLFKKINSLTLRHTKFPLHKYNVSVTVLNSCQYYSSSTLMFPSYVISPQWNNLFVKKFSD